MGSGLVHIWASVVSAAALLAVSAGAASAAALAQTPSISGNGWVALGLIIAFIGMIVMIVFGTLHLEKRDAYLGRRRDDGYLFPIPGGQDDDDFHHHGGGHGNGHGF